MMIKTVRERPEEDEPDAPAPLADNCRYLPLFTITRS